ncbi:MAG: hypothetical protein JST11_25675 [Acidobacteria bacterium]|nr:hypothetical protein [Acidobacteriota bacterium]
MRAFHFLLRFVVLSSGVSGALGAIELQPATVNAWDDYLRATAGRMQARLDGRQSFLWIDGAPDRRARLQRGEILIAPAAGRGTFAVPSGIIHHWIGAVFIPHATLDDLFAVVHDYDRYKQFYQPVVAESKTLACTGAGQQFSMIWRHRILFIDAAVEGWYEARDTRLDARRGYSEVSTTQIREFEDFGRGGEDLLPPGQGNGFIWRMHSIARYEESDGGVYLEIEAIALTRDIPPSLRWMVNPVVRHLSIDSLTTTLRQTRDAVNALPVPPARLTSRAGSGPSSGAGDSDAGVARSTPFHVLPPCR